MRIFVKVRPGAGSDKVEKTDDTHYVVWVKEPPQKGQANKGVIRVLASFFNKPKTLVVVKSGQNSPTKVIEIF